MYWAYEPYDKEYWGILGYTYFFFLNLGYAKEYWSIPLALALEEVDLLAHYIHHGFSVAHSAREEERMRSRHRGNDEER